MSIKMNVAFMKLTFHRGYHDKKGVDIMLEKAKEKLRTEMEQNKDNGYIQFIGQALLDHLRNAPGAAEAILTEGKSIAKSLDAMEMAARKKPRKGNCVMLTPDEGMKIILEYFGINASAQNTTKIEAASDFQDSAISSQQSSDFNIRLEDLLL